ncbi:hypothetical protein [Salicibibacter kimchii]|uniref:Uncharacterized protein n=1 Tax=Salicibibacter kimchii TaxID=2099786 RepID=A0A345BUH3_9BACI|nr:hypothetical protein [Salicibibacter kimchii]AXF54604.1 hypothetical protein DT065_00285 [Salicibibacter kimchii]
MKEFYQRFSDHQLHRIYNEYPEERGHVAIAWRKMKGLPYPYTLNHDDVIWDDYDKRPYKGDDLNVLYHAERVKEKRENQALEMRRQYF